MRGKARTNLPSLHTGILFRKRLRRRNRQRRGWLPDCKDPDCNQDPACIETDCFDEEDNDGDGQVDCKDSDCFDDSLCYNQSCLEFYECMVATGCNCTTGTTCPKPGTPEYNACQATCAEEPGGACVNGCFDALNPKTATFLNNYEECRTTQCGDEVTDEGFASCVLEECLLEYASCFMWVLSIAVTSTTSVRAIAEKMRHVWRPAVQR